MDIRTMEKVREVAAYSANEIDKLRGELKHAEHKIRLVESMTELVSASLLPSQSETSIDSGHSFTLRQLAGEMAKKIQSVPRCEEKHE